MCIILAKSKNVKLPSEEVLKTCFENNPDGAGIMYVSKYEKKVLIEKGFMTFDSFIKRFRELKKEYNDFKNRSLVVHFRIATHGTKVPGNTHPFPISNKVKALKSTRVKTTMGVAHNGIIRDYGLKDDENSNDLSDTMNFTKRVLAPLLYHFKDFNKNEDINFMITNLIGYSKLAILDNEDNLYWYGDYVLDENGVKYSNSTYKRYEYKNSYVGKYYDSMKSNYKQEEKPKMPKKEDLVHLSEKWYIEKNNYDWAIVPNNKYYYDPKTKTVYYECFDGKLTKFYTHCDIFNEDGEEVYFNE